MSFNPDRINIHELTIEGPEKQAELPFDVERDITKEDWEKLRDGLEKNRQESNWYGYSSRAMQMKILDPSQVLNLDQHVWNGMKETLEVHRRNREWYGYSTRAMQMKILDPKRDLNIDRAAWQGMTDTLEGYRKTNMWDDFSQLAMDIKILDPKQDLGLDPVAWKAMVATLETSKVGGHLDAWRAMELKIIDPNQDLNINASVWREMKDRLEEFRREDSAYDFSWQAMAMKILVAEEVKVTENGLELTMPEKKGSFNADIPPIPEIKKF